MYNGKSIHNPPALLVDYESIYSLETDALVQKTRYALHFGIVRCGLSTTDLTVDDDGGVMIW